MLSFLFSDAVVCDDTKCYSWQKSWFFFLIFYLYCHTETNRLSCSKEFRNVSFKRKTLFKRIMKAIILIVMLNRKQKSSVENKQISLRRAKITLFLFILCWKRTWNFREIFLTLFECIIQTLSVSVSLLCPEENYFALLLWTLYFK